MKENVSLIKKKQKSFGSSVDKYKKLLKKGEIKVQEKPVAKKIIQLKERGLVYIGNIPHGFYENEVKDYFKQFGSVTRIRVARSKKTGASKGYAFVEFREPEVAKIVAETMNNYLMGKRLLKAQYIPLEKRENKDFFKGKNFTTDNYPTLVNRRKDKNNKNSILSEQKVMEKNKNALKSIKLIQKKLKKLGIEYDFKPVDVPSYLSNVKNLDSADSSSNSETDSYQESSNDDIVFTPPAELIKSINEKIKQKNPNKREQKLVGVTKKSKTKVAKPTKVKDKKANLIKMQISNKDQIKIKSPKKIKSEKVASKIKSPKK